MPRPKQRCFVVVVDMRNRKIGLAAGPYPTIEAAEAAVDAARAAAAEKYPDTAGVRAVAWGTASFPARPAIQSHFGVL